MMKNALAAARTIPFPRFHLKKSCYIL